MVGEPMRSKETIREEIRRTTERLNSYYAREKEMLEGGTQAYTVGSRSLQRYQTSLSAIQEEIRKLEKKLNELNAELNSGSSRRAVSVVPHDW